MSSLVVEKLIIDIPSRADGTPLSFTIEAGQRWAVLGPNGAGKTTLLHTLAGLRKPRSGDVLLDGRSLASLPRKVAAQHIALVFQDRQEGFPATVLETAMIGRHPFLAPWDIESSEDLATAREALAAMSLAGYEDRLVSTLSGGERQRLAIATAKTQSPRIWLADEPTNHLDLKHQVSIMRLLSDEAAQGQSICMCLHDVNLAARWCSHVLLLYPTGEACWGEASTMLQQTALERLYGQALDCIKNGDQRYFVPSTRATP